MRDREALKDLDEAGGVVVVSVRERHVRDYGISPVMLLDMSDHHFRCRSVAPVYYLDRVAQQVGPAADADCIAAVIPGRDKFYFNTHCTIPFAGNGRKPQLKLASGQG